ncbi:MAG TPA: hypothetical protein VGQ99_14285 [Tepidisphaeraceae bacterium]|nr:hypothetical protein [Tepidisphaeraceae bacterium]
MKPPLPLQYAAPLDEKDRPGAARWWLIALLLIIGIAAWLTVGRALFDWPNQVPALMSGGAILVVMIIPAVRRVSIEGMRWLEAKLQNRVGLTAIIIAILSACYFAFTAIRQGRYLHPHWHDELSYVIQMRMLAQGELWMPVHPAADFFETFYLITDRVYASIYFPGAALLFVPEIWLHLPLITFPICAAGAAVGLTYWILARLIDPVSALVGALLMISVQMLRMASIMVMSNVPVLLMGLLLIFSFMHWQRERRMRWALAMGFFAGWAAVSRPLEATCFAVPVGLAILLRLREWDWQKRLAMIGLILAGAVPFLTLQVIMNHNITGNWRMPAWQYYSNRDFPQTTMGFRKFDPSIRPVSKLPQKQRIFDLFVKEAVNSHQPHLLLKQWIDFRGPKLVEGTMPYSILVIFLPLGISLCKSRWRWVVAGVLPMFVVLYAISVVFQVYYPIVLIPSVLLLVLLGIDALSCAMGRHAELVRATLLLWAGLMAFSALPEAGRDVKDRLFEPSLIRKIDDWEQNWRGNRALVLFRCSPQGNIDEDPVFNTTAAWPDDARIIRAQDLGAENHKLFEYYAKIQPDREVYLFDEGTRSYRRLGTAAELAK